MLTENKTHLINKVPSLTQDQQGEIISWFEKNPNKENSIDWNKLAQLQYKDFQDIMGLETKSSRKRKVKDKGLEGLILDKDYGIALSTPNILGLVPLNYEASKLIASRYVGGSEGAWCTAYQKTRMHWDNYATEGSMLVYFINLDPENTSWHKLAMSVHPEGYLDIVDASDEDMPWERVYECIPPEELSQAARAAPMFRNKLDFIPMGENAYHESSRMLYWLLDN